MSAPVTCYLHHAIPLSIISAGCGWDWIFNHYINVYQPAEAYRFEFFPRSPYCLGNGCLNIFTTTDTLAGIGRENLLERLRLWIDGGFYVQCFFAISELRDTMFFGSNGLLHQTLVYGYRGREKIITANFNTKKQFSSIELEAGAFLAACFSPSSRRSIRARLKKHGRKLPVRSLFFELIRYETARPPLLDPKKVAAAVADYCESTNLLRSPRGGGSVSAADASWSLEQANLLDIKYDHFPTERNCRWGISTIYGLCEYLREAGGQALDVRLFRGLLEHKRLMASRIEAFEQRGLIDPGRKLSARYGKIRDMAVWVYMLGLKYNIQMRESILMRMVNLIDTLCAEEQAVLRSFQRELS